jgi:hypothetical protein
MEFPHTEIRLSMLMSGGYLTGFAWRMLNYKAVIGIENWQLVLELGRMCSSVPRYVEHITSFAGIKEDVILGNGQPVLRTWPTVLECARVRRTHHKLHQNQGRSGIWVMGNRFSELGQMCWSVLQYVGHITSFAGIEEEVVFG